MRDSTRNERSIGTRALAGAALAAALAAGAHAQPVITSWTIDSGGGTSSGGAFVLSGTIGQPDAGPTLTGGNFSLTGGFWFPACDVDINGDGLIGSPDLTLYVNTWLGDLANGTILADFPPGSGGPVGSPDLTNYINAWLSALTTGCP